MAKVKVWNDNIYDFTSTFKGEKLTVPAGGFVLLDFEEAQEFRGQWSPMPPEDFAGDERTFYKMIRVEAGPAGYVVPTGFINQVPGQRFETQKELDFSLEPYRGRLVKDELADKEANDASNNKEALLHAEIARLRQELAEANEPEEKRGPGRPRKKESA